MKKRNLIAFILLCLLTCGIYLIYWIYKTRLAFIAENGNEASVPPLSYVYGPLLVLVAVAVILFWFGDSDAVAILSTVVAMSAAITAIIMGFVLMYRLCIVSGEIFKTNDGVSIFWLWIVGTIFAAVPLGPVLIQYNMNQHLAEQETGDTKTKAKSKPAKLDPPTAPSV